MRHKKLILFFVALGVATMALFALSSNDNGVRGQDPNVQAHGLNGGGTPAIGTSGTGASVQPASSWRGDAAWLDEAAALNVKEVALADLAQRRANDMQVKRYAAELNRDHAAANEELRALAARKKWVLSDSIDALQEQTLAALDRSQGPEFDRAFVEAMIQSHERGVSTFQAAVSAATDPELKAWTEKHLPTLQKHLEHARSLKR